MDHESLSVEEIVRLRRLLVYEEILAKEAEYKAAKSLVLRTWKNVVIGVGAVIAAVAAIYALVQAAFRHMLIGP